MADQVGLDIGAGVDQAVAHAGLGGEVDDAVGVAAGFGQRRRIGDVAAHEAEIVVFLQPRQPRFLQRHVVIVVEIVDADDGVAALEQTDRGMHADETGRSCHKYGHGRHSFRVRVSGKGV